MILVFGFSQENVYVPIHIYPIRVSHWLLHGRLGMAPSYQCVRNFWE